MQSIGIDLGTTNSVASHVVGGKPVVILNRFGADLTPSVVAYRDGQGYLVGMEAVNYAATAPQDAIFSVKRLMGLDFEDLNVQEARRRVSYTIGPSDDPANDRSAHVMIAGKPQSPIEISRLILEHIKTDCMQRLGRRVESATITVPAYFQDCQKNATREAGQRAGLNLRPLLTEPVAAALAFVSGDAGNVHRILVYDLGGGTFDVSIVQIAGPPNQADDKNIQVLEIAGDMWLGGDDFDHAIAQRVFDWIASRYRYDGRQSPQLRRLVKAVAENAKKKLSERDAYQIIEPHLMTLPGGDPLSLDLTITRQDFERDIRPLVDKSLALVDRVLAKRNLSADNLTSVLLVGGSTYVPLIRQEMQRRFGVSKVRFDVNPMQCVSLGAALWNERFPMDNAGRLVLKKLDQTGLPVPMNIGIEVFRDSNPHAFEVVVPRGTLYPNKLRHPRAFRPTAKDQRVIRVPIFQGESDLTTLNYCQGIFEWKLPQALPADAPIIITFEIDVDGTLMIEVEAAGQKYQGKLDRNKPMLTPDQQDRLGRWKEDLETALIVGERFLKKYREYLTPDDIAQLEKCLKDGQAALASHDRDAGMTQDRAIRLLLVGSGTASVLYQAERARELASGEMGEKIALAMKHVENAHKVNDPKLSVLRDTLLQAAWKVLGVHSAQHKGPMVGQLTVGNI